MRAWIRTAYGNVSGNTGLNGVLTGPESQAYAGGKAGDKKDAEEVSMVECFVQV